MVGVFPASSARPVVAATRFSLDHLLTLDTSSAFGLVMALLMAFLMALLMAFLMAFLASVVGAAVALVYHVSHLDTMYHAAQRRRERRAGLPWAKAG
jgi:uncharacterized protein YacL